MPRKKTFVKCSVCGADVDAVQSFHCNRKNWPVMCKACCVEYVKQKRAEKAAKKAEEMNKKLDLHCAVCGKAIPWIPDYSCAARIPKTCSRSCGVKLAMRDRTYTKEMAEEKIKDYIKSVGHEMTYKEIVEGCGIKTTILTRFKISLLMLQKEVLGISCDRVHRKDPAIPVEPLAVVKEKLQLEGEDFECVKTLIKQEQAIEPVIEYLTSLIGSQRKYIGVVELMEKTGLCFETLDKYDIIGINKKLGFSRDRRSWVEDDLYLKLVEKFGSDDVSREHTFMDCRGPKGWPLRFDYFLIKENVVVELDGSSHEEGNPLHKDYTDTNRQIKEEYTREHGIRLIPISYKRGDDINDLAEKLVLEILKPVELLETPSGQSATKPVEIQEGSETIEKDQQC